MQTISHTKKTTSHELGSVRNRMRSETSSRSIENKAELLDSLRGVGQEPQNPMEVEQKPQDAPMEVEQKSYGVSSGVKNPHELRVFIGTNDDFDRFLAHKEEILKAYYLCIYISKRALKTLEKELEQLKEEPKTQPELHSGSTCSYTIIDIVEKYCRELYVKRLHFCTYKHREELILELFKKTENAADKKLYLDGRNLFDYKKEVLVYPIKPSREHHDIESIFCYVPFKALTKNCDPHVYSEYLSINMNDCFSKLQKEEFYKEVELNERKIPSTSLTDCDVKPRAIMSDPPIQMRRKSDITDQDKYFFPELEVDLQHSLVIYFL